MNPVFNLNTDIRTHARKDVRTRFFFIKKINVLPAPVLDYLCFLQKIRDVLDSELPARLYATHVALPACGVLQRIIITRWSGLRIHWSLHMTDYHNIKFSLDLWQSVTWMLERTTNYYLVVYFCNRIPFCTRSTTAATLLFNASLVQCCVTFGCIH